MAQSERTGKKGAAVATESVATEPLVRSDRPEVLHAKPEELDCERFERLYKRVTKRIPKTLAILAE